MPATTRLMQAMPKKIRSTKSDNQVFLVAARIRKDLTMNQIPNWFRWLIIIVATLIMCACRSPLQDGQQLLPPVVPHLGVQPHDVGALPRGIEAKAAAISKKLPNAKPASVRHETRTSVVPPKPIRGPSRSEFAPVVSHIDGGFQIEEIESQLITQTQDRPEANSPALNAIAESLARVASKDAPASKAGALAAPIPNTAEQVSSPADAFSYSDARPDSRTAASNAVYMRINDEVAEGIELANAQLDAVIGTDLGSPFGDDPVVPVPAEPPVAPPVQNEFVEQPQLETIVSQPMLTDDAALPIEHQPTILSPAPYEEYLPCIEIPVEVSPENWAADPSDGLNASLAELSRHYPDEYICDGGDGAGGVRVMSDWTLRNLEPEDTVGHYDTRDHRVVVEPSNRVCIYAPRFAAARKVSSPFQNEKSEQVLLAERETKAIVEQAEQLSDQYIQTLSPQRHLGLQPAAGLRVRLPGVEVVRRQAVNILDHDLSVHEDLRVIKYGVHKQSEKARLAEFAAKAVSWSHDKAVQVVVDEEVVQTKVSRQGTDTIFFIGDNGPAKLRVIKTASTADALPGEEVEFTLRFDNIGYQKIGNVTIIDNLTTRLEFIEDSDLCSEECEFIVDENGVESLTLRWEITAPIDPGKGGLIRFRCRVR